MSSNVQIPANPNLMAQLNAQFARKNGSQVEKPVETNETETTKSVGMTHLHRPKMAAKRTRPTMTFNSEKAGDAVATSAKETVETKTVHVTAEKSGTSKFAIIAGLMAALAGAYMLWANYKV